LFVRWTHRPSHPRRLASPPNERVLYAALMESQRVDGKARQRVVRCLAAIRGGRLVYPMSTAQFWRDADCTLTDLGVDNDERQGIEARIAATIPRPGAAIGDQRLEAGALTMAIAAMCAGRGKRHCRTAVTVGMGLPT
jgi:hypothetical protein